MAKKETTAAAALEIIVSRYGIDTFRDRRRAFALLTDLAPGDANAKDRRRIRQALDSGAAEILLKAAESGTGGELHINESVSRLMEQTDMAEEFARQTVEMLANAFGVSAEDGSDYDEDDDDEIGVIAALHGGSRKTETSRRRSKGANIGKIIGIIAIALAAAGIVGGFIAGLLLLAPVPKQWLIAAGCGIALTAGTVGLSFAVENWTCNEKCQTITFAIPVLIAGNIVLRALLGESYALISRILFGFLAAGSIANIVLTRTEGEEGYTLPNVIFAAVGALLVLTWPGDWHWLSNWKVWQWVIGIGGGLVLSAFVALLAFVLDDTGPEAKHTLTVSILIFTIVNLILVVVVGKEKYDIIAKCIFAFLAVGSLITTFIAFNDMSPILGWLNLALTVLNGGAFLFLILGSYEVLMNFINPVLEFFKKGKQTA